MDDKITIGSDLGQSVRCSMCQREGVADQFIAMRDAKGQDVYLCPSCKDTANREFERETKDPNFALGALFGAVGGAVGGLVWYLVAVSTDMEIGYISLGLGYLVGYGVYLGAGKKRGAQLQALSAVLALLSIFVTKKFIFDYALNQYIQANIAEFPLLPAGQRISLGFFHPAFLESLVSPIGLLIYAIGVYIAYQVCKPKKI